MTDTTGWTWFTGDPAALAPYVVDHLFVGHSLLPSDIEALRPAPRALTGRLYGAVRDRGIHYEGDPPFILDRYLQRIRQPADLLLEQGTGNCLDLSLMFAGLCVAARLRPLLALLRTVTGRRHVLVLVSLAPSGAGDDVALGGIPITRQGWCELTHGRVAEVLNAGEFVAVEITAATMEKDALPYELACEKGAHAFEGSTEIKIVDPVYLQSHGHKPDPAARGLFGPTPGNPVFGSEVAKAYGRRLGTRPTVWDLWHVSRIPTEPGTQAHDTRLALVRALLALGAFEAVAGRKPRLSKLKSIYFQAVGRDSDAMTAEVMLVDAATVERENELPGLVRFILAIGAILEIERTEDQEEVLRTWLRSQEAQADDMDALRNVTYWALIDLGEEKNQDLSPDWQRTLSITVTPPITATEPLQIECNSETEFESALATLMKRLFDALPDDDPKLVVDLVAPRYLLDRRVEHLEVVPAGPLRLALSPQYRPRLRWWLHLRNPQVRKLQADRELKADWSTEPQLVPLASGENEDLLKAWLDNHQIRARPCLIAGTTDGSCDPLKTLLLKGQGFILWYPDGSHAANDPAVRELWATVEGTPLFKREMMPDRLLDHFVTNTPAMIWNDLSGRGSFRLRAGRLAGPSGGDSK